MPSEKSSRPSVILLVEDDPGDQAMVRRAVEDGDVRARLEVVEDGVQALDYLLRQGVYDAGSAPRPDLVLLDLNLPRMNGHEVLERIRATDELRQVPVVFLTTSSHANDISRAYELGANSYVVKPSLPTGYADTLRRLETYWLDFVHLPSDRR